MEVEKSLFSIQVGSGIYIWNCCRLDVYQHLLQLYGIEFATSSLPRTNLVRSIVSRLKNQLWLRYILIRRPKFIFVTAQRVAIGNSIVDIISDHLMLQVTPNVVAIELLNRRSCNLLRMLLGLNTRIPPVFTTRNKQYFLNDVNSTINKAIYDYFDVSLDVSNIIACSLAKYQANYKFFAKLYTHFRPYAIIGVNDNTLFGLYAASKDFGVPTIELQHGASNENTLLWSYPRSIESSHVGLSLPTAYLTFSDYWRNNTHYPVGISRSIGNDSLYLDIIPSKSKGLLVVSAYMYYNSLLRLSMDLSPLVDIPIYFKLHPHEYRRKSETISFLKCHKNITVISDDYSFSELFELCDYVVVVHSSMAYQALQAGKSVCIYKISNYFWHSDIFDFVHLFETPTGLLDIISGHLLLSANSNHPNRPPLLYAPFDASAFKLAVNELIAPDYIEI